MLYCRRYINRLSEELADRYDTLQRVLHMEPRGSIPSHENVEIEGLDVRLAVEGFRAILTEMKRLK